MSKAIFLVKALEGFSPQIGHLVSQMNYARATTLQAVEKLTVEQLDYLMQPDGNSIGMLLEHMAGVESWYQCNTFEQRDFNEQERMRWAAGALGEKRTNIKGNKLEFYLNQLSEVRTRTLKELSKRDDAWLYEEDDWEGPVNNYWKWFHVFEDELSHRGQIRMIRKAALNTLSDN